MMCRIIYTAIPVYNKKVSGKLKKIIKMEEKGEINGLESIKRCQDNLELIEDCFNDLINDNNYEKSYNKLSIIEKSKLDVGLAYGLASLLYMTLKSQVR